jgi:hypothetical protein
LDSRAVAAALVERCPALTGRVWARGDRPTEHTITHVVIDRVSGQDGPAALDGRPGEDQAGWHLICVCNTPDGAEGLAQSVRAGMTGWMPDACSPVVLGQGPLLEDDGDLSEFVFSVTVTLATEIGASRWN